MRPEIVKIRYRPFKNALEAKLISWDVLTEARELEKAVRNKPHNKRESIVLNAKFDSVTWNRETTLKISGP
jgi:hypothetical protein